MQRVLDAVNERLYPELVYQLRDRSLNSPNGVSDPSVAWHRSQHGLVNLVEQTLSVGGQIGLLFPEIVIFHFVSHRPATDAVLCQRASVGKVSATS
jgi:hypothetical protein